MSNDDPIIAAFDAAEEDGNCNVDEAREEYATLLAAYAARGAEVDRLRELEWLVAQDDAMQAAAAAIKRWTREHKAVKAEAKRLREALRIAQDDVIDLLACGFDSRRREVARRAVETISDALNEERP